MSKSLKKVQFHFKNINNGIQACRNYFCTCDYHTVSSRLSAGGPGKFSMLAKRGGLAFFQFLGRRVDFFRGDLRIFRKLVS